MAKKVSVTGIFLFLMFTFLTGCNDDSSPVSPVVSNGVIGTWVNEIGLEYTFNANGKVTGSAIDLANQFFVIFSGGSAPTWTFNATQIFIDGELTSTYTITDNTLTMKDSDGEDVILTRKE